MIRATVENIDEQLQRILAQRADALATRRRDDEVDRAQRLAILTFRLGDARYGIELTALSQVVALTQCTPVPKAPPQVAGVVNLRGEVCCVIDLAALLGRAVSDDDDAGRYVLTLRESGGAIGLRVDAVEQVDHPAMNELSESPQGDDCVRGVTAAGVCVLDMNAVIEQKLKQLNIEA